MDNVVGTIQDRREPYLDAEYLIEKVAAEWLEESADLLGEDVAPAPVDPTGPDRCRPARFGRGTVRGYADKIAYFVAWWQEVGPAAEWRLTRRGLREFERWLRKRQSKFGNTLAFNTRRDALRRLRQMLLFGEIEGIIQGVQPSMWVPTPDGSPPEYEVPRGEELMKLIEAARSGPQPVRDMAILATLIGTGMRRAECASLRIEDVHLREDDHSGEIVIRNPKKVRGSEDKPSTRRVAIDAISGRYLHHWMQGLGRKSGPLWPSLKTGDSLSPQGIYGAVKRCWQRAGMKANQPSHDLRRVYVSEWRRVHGNSLDRELGLQVGHAAPRMSDHYDRRQVDAVLEVVRSPMAPVGTPAEKPANKDRGILVADWPQGGHESA